MTDSGDRPNGAGGEIEQATVPGEADNLLDKILKNALAPKVKGEVKKEGVKGEGVKGEVKKEGIKSEIKAEKGIKQEKLDALPDIGENNKLMKKKKKKSRSRKRKRSRSRKRKKSSSSSRSLSKSP